VWQIGHIASRVWRIEGGTVKSIVTSVAELAVLAVVGGAATGLSSNAAAIAPLSGMGQVQLTAVGVPRPQDPPAPNLPNPDQLASLCTQVTDPGVSYTTKTNLVENGITPDEGHVADHDLRKAYRDGKFPETFDVTNIASAGPNATADVAISGPKFAGPVTKQLMFVNQGGNWILSHDSAIALIQAATG
jgi:hypothetical protein